MSSEPKEIQPKHSSKEDVAIVTNDAYEPILLAGSGSIGIVYFSLSRQDHDAAVKTKATNTFEDLRSKLVTVKVCPDMHLDSVELKTLQTLKENVDEDTEKMFASLVASGHPWIATKAIVPSVSLISLTDLEHPVAKELVLHFLLEMTKACIFMHEVCEPRFVHRDLHLGNMLIDASYQTECGFPGLVVIDFDQSEPVNIVNAWSEWRVDSCVMVSYLLKKPYGKEVDGWHDINHAWFDGTGPVSLRSLRDTLQDMLTEAMASMTPDKMRSILDPVKAVIAKKEDDLRQAFREAGLMD
ncbi:uncharacterized protein N0V89_006779 [Didymosphaeria variabile]|uniref:Protein kinase domain-containing protein n=1 Tax=Didymosphaeria variabile TaxID=1932322 RepID=A0A9W8XIF0_9PLEO|nr:uncharacterized protein N0V89_006779 [Didymosphaeria variabile]KAJ4351437.1 hypothetical protein N0V89_006779 [Didymosphaeria variabile]